jgi:hypothetical protein
VIDPNRPAKNALLNAIITNTEETVSLIPPNTRKNAPTPRIAATIQGMMPLRTSSRPLSRIAPMAPPIAPKKTVMVAMSATGRSASLFGELPGWFSRLGFSARNIVIGCSHGQELARMQEPRSEVRPP